MSKTSEIVQHYREMLGREMGKKKPLSYRALSGLLAHDLAPRRGISYGTLQSWEVRGVEPDYWLLAYLVDLKPNTLAGKMAAEILSQVGGDGAPACDTGNLSVKEG